MAFGRQASWNSDSVSGRPSDLFCPTIHVSGGTSLRITDVSSVPKRAFISLLPQKLRPFRLHSLCAMAPLKGPLIANGDDAPQPARPSTNSEACSDGSGEVAPRLHAKTFLAVLAVCLIYFAQLVSIVGAGVVSWPDPSSPTAAPEILKALRSKHKPSPPISTTLARPSGSPLHSPSSRLSSGR
jgi:hypothetical protein